MLATVRELVTKRSAAAEVFVLIGRSTDLAAVNIFNLTAALCFAGPLF